jgi:hypothetical protein
MQQNRTIIFGPNAEVSFFQPDLETSAHSRIATARVRARQCRRQRPD